MTRRTDAPSFDPPSGSRSSETGWVYRSSPESPSDVRPPQIASDDARSGPEAVRPAGEPPSVWRYAWLPFAVAFAALLAPFGSGRTTGQRPQ